MRFLADEHIPAGVIASLRANGHEVFLASETGRGAPDELHVSFAAQEHLIILTEDEDFTARVRESAVLGDPLPLALIHYRLDGMGRTTKQARMADSIVDIGEIAPETIYSVEPTRIRSRGMRD